MSIPVSKFLDVSEGLQPNQFSVGERAKITSISDLDPTYKQLMDKPIACVMAVMGGDGRPNLTPMWFDYEGDKVLVNVAVQRRKTEWIRKTPQMTMILMNPENMYHWMSIKVTVDREISEDDPEEGARVTEQLDRIWKKYIGQGDEYGLRDPSIDERRILFECSVDKIATFGVPG
ncbi:MAG: pyridoxamine 5'-phosphate oxidase family protein [Acidimicrobiia bacterium]|nr:pyridoxamine 5'-phosphate oxidase family protein [Acidimicrobiia bacterium]